MYGSNNKCFKPQKTKFKKNKDRENFNLEKKRHHDKTYYRLAKEEKDEYGLHTAQI